MSSPPFLYRHIIKRLDCVVLDSIREDQFEFYILRVRTFCFFQSLAPFSSFFGGGFIASRFTVSVLTPLISRSTRQLFSIIKLLNPNHRLTKLMAGNHSGAFSS